MGSRYVSPEMAPATLRAGKVLYQWLGATQRSDGETVLRIMSIERGSGTSADRYVIHIMMKIDDPEPATLDVVFLPDADPDGDDEVARFDTAEEALAYCASGGARPDRFVIGGMICDEFLDYLRWNGRAPVQVQSTRDLQRRAGATRFSRSCTRRTAQAFAASGVSHSVARTRSIFAPS